MSSSRLLPLALVVLALLASLVSCQSINSPRQTKDGKGSGGGGTAGDVFVRLPSDVQSVLDLQKSDRARIHASILGQNQVNKNTGISD